MFDFLADKLQTAFQSLTGKGLLTEADVDAALRELRLSLLEADVALPAIKHLLAGVRAKAVGQNVLKGVNPGQQVVKIVYDELAALLGDTGELTLNAAPPVVILLCGLQGSGKTTTAGKLAKWLAEKQRKKVFLASLDVYRPAAIEQLATVAGQVGVPVLESDSTDPIARTKQALKAAEKALSDILILDTAGRGDVDETLLAELAAIHKLSKPANTLLVADAQMGQAATTVANAFKQTVPLTGLILTRLDGDARGGAVLSMRHETGVPVAFVGLGEGLDKLEPFRADGIAGRILGQGDVVSLVEKVQSAVSEDEAASLQAKLMSGQGFDMNDIKKQIGMMRKMGGMGMLMDLMPGMGALKKQVDQSKLDPKVLARQVAVIDSMTAAERKNPTILNAKRRQRIALGAGVQVSDVNKIVKMHEQLNQVTKLLKKGGIKGLMGMLGQR
ncbi:MAG: signal recognition particle protein [Pseudomonadaceae bacterium]|nr:signal recognition particle protein [Pseudomonadaceae bacterium]